MTLTVEFSAVLWFLAGYLGIGVVLGELYRVSCRLGRRAVSGRTYWLGVLFWPGVVMLMVLGGKQDG